MLAEADEAPAPSESADELPEADSLCASASSEDTVSEVGAMLSILPPLAPGLPSALVEGTCELDGDWALCSHRRPSSMDRFDRMSISKSHVTDEAGGRHCLVYTRKGPQLFGAALERRGASLLWKDPAGVRVYLRCTSA